MREWSQDGNPNQARRNLYQAMHAKVGNLRYSAYFDPDVYRSVIQRFLFEDLSAPFGRWGFGVVMADGAASTLYRLELLPVEETFGGTPSDTRLRMYYLRLEIAYRDVQTFHVGVSTTIHLDSRALRPGDKR
jgi:hypothetical protein